MGLHAPSKGWFVTSLIIAVIAVVRCFIANSIHHPLWIWVAILAYIVLAISSLAQSNGCYASSNTERSILR